MSFSFSGEIPASKSILNRLLTIKSYSSSFSIIGDSRCDDVLAMKSALPKILAAQGEAAHCGAAGTTLRFLALRASRIPGRHLLTGTPQLLERPQEELCRLVDQLGSSCKMTDVGLVIEGAGWKKSAHVLRIDRSQSSQFASAVLLNAWKLPFDLHLEFRGLEGGAISQGYLDMTSALVQKAGMALKEVASGFVVPAESSVKNTNFIAEPDFSSAFAIAAMGAVAGRVELLNFPEASLQPDAVFPSLLEKMGAQVDRRNDRLCIMRGNALKALSIDLKNCPDLFPILSVLCALAEGRSRLFGAPHLAYKESSRIESTAVLLKKLGCTFEVKNDGIELVGGGKLHQSPQTFDPLDDHRLAMAAAVANVAGAKIQILHPEVVNKSFPEFWEILDTGNRTRERH